MQKNNKIKSELISLLVLNHNTQAKLLKPKVHDVRFLYLLGVIKKAKLVDKLVSKI